MTGYLPHEGGIPQGDVPAIGPGVPDDGLGNAEEVHLPEEGIDGGRLPGIGVGGRTDASIGVEEVELHVGEHLVSETSVGGAATSRPKHVGRIVSRPSDGR